MEWEKTKFGLLSAAGGVVVLAIIAFTWDGWVTTGIAEDGEEDRSKCCWGERPLYRKAELGDHAG